MIVHIVENHGDFINNLRYVEIFEILSGDKGTRLLLEGVNRHESADEAMMRIMEDVSDFSALIQKLNPDQYLIMPLQAKLGKMQLKDINSENSLVYYTLMLCHLQKCEHTCNLTLVTLRQISNEYIDIIKRRLIAEQIYKAKKLGMVVVGLEIKKYGSICGINAKERIADFDRGAAGIIFENLSSPNVIVITGAAHVMCTSKCKNVLYFKTISTDGEARIAEKHILDDLLKEKILSLPVQTLEEFKELIIQKRKKDLYLQCAQILSSADSVRFSQASIILLSVILSKLHRRLFKSATSSTALTTDTEALAAPPRSAGLMRGS